MKYLSTILISVTILFGVGILLAGAAEQPYIPLAPLPIGEGGAILAQYTLSTYLSGMLKFLVAGAGVLAILMLILAGTRYVAAGISPSAKGHAKDDMMHAIVGLALVLGSYLILNTINPDLVNFKLKLPQALGKPTPPATVIPPTPAPWLDDSVERNQLAGILFNHDNCTNIGDLDCTSVAGLLPATITSLRNLRTSCGGVSCNLTINGGTEYWLHRNKSTDISANDTFHKPSTSPGGGKTIDLKRNATLDAYLVGAGTADTTTQCAPGTPRRRIGNALYVAEDAAHWHVCYY